MTKSESGRQPPLIYLVGLRGSGKSTVGRLLAERLGFTFIDCDQLIEERQKQSIANFFQHNGEAAFRDAEAALLRELAGGRNHVIATGGGCVIRPENRALLRATGGVIWLTGTPATLSRRLECDPATASRRPALSDTPAFAEIERLATEREPWYCEVANLTIATDERSPEEVATAILNAWPF